MGVSYASVPSTAAFSVMVPAVCHDDSREIFGIFPAHLAPETKAEGSAKVGGQGFTIHAISEQRLRMESVCHVVGFPQCAHKCPALIGIRKRLEDDVSRLRTRSGKIQHGRQPHAGPFGNVGPALLAGRSEERRVGKEGAARMGTSFQAEDGIRDRDVTGVQTCALPIWRASAMSWVSHNARTSVRL